MNRSAGLSNRMFLCVSTLIALVVLSGCGGSSNHSVTAKPVPGLTTVVLQAGSDANARFVGFGMSLDSLSLTNKAGVTTKVYSTPVPLDFLPWNANAGPIAEFSVLRDEYTAASVELSGVWFTYMFANSQGGITTSTDEFGYLPVPPTVTLARPITVSGPAMGILLDLQADKSGTYTGSSHPGLKFDLTPVFELTSFGLPGGASQNILAQVTSLASGGGSVTLQLPGGSVLQGTSMSAGLNAATVYQGISGAGELAPGMIVNVDTAVQPDGTYTVTRVEVTDKTVSDAVLGQMMEWFPGSSYLLNSVDRQAGTKLFASPVGRATPVEYSTTTQYAISHQFFNAAGLPFTPVFDSTSVAPGQMVQIGASSISSSGGVRSQAHSLTLMPQYINATVLDHVTSGRFDVYTVQLAPYDLIVQMNSIPSPGNTTLRNAQTVHVYMESGAAQPGDMAPGRVYRFHGWLLNDAGALRLVCDRIVNGVEM